MPTWPLIQTDGDAWEVLKAVGYRTGTAGIAVEAHELRKALEVYRDRLQQLRSTTAEDEKGALEEQIQSITTLLRVYEDKGPALHAAVHMEQTRVAKENQKQAAK